MASEANLPRKVLVQRGQGDGGCCRRLGGSAFPVLPALLSCSNPISFMGLCTTVNRCLPLCSVHSCLLPRVVADAEAFSDTLRVSLKCFFWPPRERLPCWSSPNEFLAESIVQHVNYSVHGLHSIAESASR